MRPPRHALHGPWDTWDTVTDPEGLEIHEPWASEVKKAFKEACVAAIDAGECKCACCRLTKQCAQLEHGYMWLRQPTPKAKRAKSGESEMVCTWPLWIYEDIR